MFKKCYTPLEGVHSSLPPLTLHFLGWGKLWEVKEDLDGLGERGEVLGEGRDRRRPVGEEKGYDAGGLIK